MIILQWIWFLAHTLPIFGFFHHIQLRNRIKQYHSHRSIIKDANSHLDILIISPNEEILQQLGANLANKLKFEYYHFNETKQIFDSTTVFSPRIRGLFIGNQYSETQLHDFLCKV